jgi:glycosyltransferase involved in cell wall biosynthesis
MKILYVCSDGGVPVLGCKGASVHVRQFIAALARADCRIVLATPSLTKSPWDVPAEIAAQVIHCRLSESAQDAVQSMKSFATALGAEAQLAGEVRRILASQTIAESVLPRFKGDPPDFIYERASLFGTAGVTLAREWNVPLIVELNAPLVEEQSLYRGAGLGALAMQAEEHTLTHADAVITVSDALREHAVAVGVDPDRVHVLPNGVDPELFWPAPRDQGLRVRLALGDGPVLGFVGGLRPWHGVEVLPELLARLAPRHAGLRLIITGGGQLRGDLESSLSERGLLDRVVFTGALPHEQIPALLRLFDVALAPYPALDHSFYFSPLKLFEYMACGVPVVASNCGQIAEVVRDGSNGLLVPPGDLEAMVAACDRLLRDQKLRTELGQAAAVLVRSRYTWNENAARVLAVAQDLIAARAVRSALAASESSPEIEATPEATAVPTPPNEPASSSAR